MTDVPDGATMGRPRLPGNAAWVFLGLGGVAMLAYLAVPSLAAVLVFGVALLSVGVVVYGLRRNEAVREHRRPWYALALGLAVFLLGAVLRAVLPGAMDNPPGATALLTDATVLPGYLAFGYALLQMLRRRRSHVDRLARMDGLLIGLGVAVAAWALWLGPRVEQHLFNAPELLSTVYPTVDVFLVILTIRLVVADGERPPALWFLVTAMGAMFTIDLCYAVYADGASTAMLGLFDLGFILGYVALGAAALHPSMTSLCRPQRVVTRAIGAPRIVGISAMVMAPTIFAYLVPAQSLTNKIVRVALAGLVVVSVVARIVRSQAWQAAAEADARHRSEHDALTELPNRELLTKTIEEWGERPDAQLRETSVVLLDIDRFKQVNDNWGHRVGDELLREVAARLTGLVSAGELVCRIGGDEFVIAATGPAPGNRAEPLAELLLETFREPLALSVGEIFVSMSIGIAQAPATAGALELIRDADLAMYQAKDADGNRYARYDDSLRDRARGRVEIEQALRGALGRGELGVHYQPIVHATDGQMCGFEALMRWTHPTLGFVSPDRFIPVAEATGLIVAAGGWLLDEAVDQLARWQHDRSADLPPLHMSINIATRQLREGDLAGRVRRALERTGLPPSALWLEITESVLMKDPEQSRATLEQLRDLGVTLCIDDFGTGYASLSYLEQIPARIVKIDRSFVDRIGQDDGQEAIVLAVIAMTHAVGQQVVAEGVETEQQWAWLSARGCDFLQGWLFGRPKAAADQDAWRSLRLEPLTGKPAADAPAATKPAGTTAAGTTTAATTTAGTTAAGGTAAGGAAADTVTAGSPR